MLFTAGSSVGEAKPSKAKLVLNVREINCTSRLRCCKENTEKRRISSGERRNYDTKCEEHASQDFFVALE